MVRQTVVLSASFHTDPMSQDDNSLPFHTATTLRRKEVEVRTKYDLQLHVLMTSLLRHLQGKNEIDNWVDAPLQHIREMIHWEQLKLCSEF